MEALEARLGYTFRDRRTAGECAHAQLLCQ